MPGNEDYLDSLLKMAQQDIAPDSAINRVKQMAEEAEEAEEVIEEPAVEETVIDEPSLEQAPETTEEPLEIEDPGVIEEPVVVEEPIIEESLADVEMPSEEDISDLLNSLGDITAEEPVAEDSAVIEEAVPEEETISQDDIASLLESIGDISTEEPVAEEPVEEAAPAEEPAAEEPAAEEPADDEEEIVELEDYDTPLGLEQTETLYVIESADVRLEADGLSAIFATLDKGTAVTAVGHEGSWTRVIIGDQIGFIYNKSLAKAMPEDENSPVVAEEPASEKTVTVFTSLRTVMEEGEPVYLTSKLEGFEDCAEIRYVWKVDKGNGFEVVEGANGDTLTYTASVESLNWSWHLTVMYR